MARSRNASAGIIPPGVEMPSSLVPSPEPAPRRWYAVQTEPRAEWMVHKRLRALGIDTLHLHYPATVRHARRVIGVLRPLFPGYVFVGLSQRQGMLTAMGERGVVSVVTGAGGVAIEVPPAVIDALRKVADEHGRYVPERDQVKLLPGYYSGPRPRRDPLSPGEQVRVTAGPFEGLLAQVELDNGGEVRVWLRMFHGLIRTAVPTEAVELVSPAGRLVPAGTPR